MRTAVLLLLTLISTGCAPHREAPITAIPTGESAVCFVRAYNSSSSTTFWPIYADGVLIAKLSNNHWACLPADPGTYLFRTAAVTNETSSDYQSSSTGRYGGQVSGQREAGVFDERETTLEPGIVTVLGLNFADGMLFMGPDDAALMDDPRIRPALRRQVRFESLRK